ncbi:MAG: hypothetical protein A2751_01755 [Candidatus Doudnabacteria bacterium RIFCSPHIGHO2_01_FULL_46_14]|uniref:Uncharacterized protein n=1 Tax=Candidatus Doudnabacteria bacterium RIFCSPHIGHO2_01_FULL_46_14 TaxID=1817824 RepID=A0A1F5NK34_9BACT|nr:MAG: hypothetical protein A2751_01755 [Candidatus Doudnabacteria bacterium RIFCSPHIGHO2_01_FULL_46_14]
MNFTHILLWLPRVLRNGGLHAARFGQVHIAKTIFTLLVGLFFSIVVLGSGVLIARLGYGINWPSLITAGNFITAFSGMVAGGWFIYSFTRIGTFAEEIVIGNSVGHQLVHEITRPLPSTPAQLPIVVTQEMANQIMRIAATVFAVLTAMSIVASVFPVYRNLTWLMVGVMIIMFGGFRYMSSALRGGQHV